MKFAGVIKKKFFYLIKKYKRYYFYRANNIFIAKGSYVHPEVKIGCCTRINTASHIGKCNIGKYCAIGGRLVVRSSDHYVSYLNMQDWAQRKIIHSDLPVAGKVKGDVSIGNAVWIGDSVIILSGVTIGNGSIIGAGSVVTKSIPHYTIAFGNPATIIKKRFSDKVINRIKDIHWWEWDIKTLSERKEIFEIDFKKSSFDYIDSILKKYDI
jgi:acetyltransferase-like isoleucine patch superfamily enzyme